MAWNTVQKKMMCCGVDGPRNWFDVNNGTASGIPSSCCKPQYIDRDTQNCLNAAPLYMDRLYQVILSRSMLRKYLKTFLFHFRTVVSPKFTIVSLQMLRF
jgi:hypothetical protein